MPSFNPVTTEKHLFLVVLGGRTKGCNVEQHDVRWVVGHTIDDTIPELKRQWFGIRRGLHIDSYRHIRNVDGYRVLINTATESPKDQEMKLWFVNLGAYKPGEMAEQHRFGLVVARSSQAAKARAKSLWLKGQEQVHKDDLHAVHGLPEIDDLLPIHGNGRWCVELSPEKKMINTNEAPDWYGYRLI